MSSREFRTRLVWVVAGVVLLNAAHLSGAEDAKTVVVPDKLPAVVKSTLTSKARASANAAKLKMPLEPAFHLPTGKGWVYEGILSMDGPGPLGMMHYKATIHLIPQVADAWPVTLEGNMKVTEYRGENAFGKMEKASPEDLGDVHEMPSIEMDHSGRVAASYNPREAPWAYLSDLWGLPLKPLDIGDSFVEAVAAEGEFTMPFKGVRSIKLVGTKNLHGVPCAIYAIESHLTAKVDVGTGAKTGLRMVVTSTVIFDASSGWPLEAKQKVRISGFVDDSGKERVLKISFDVKRVKAGK